MKLTIGHCKLAIGYLAAAWCLAAWCLAARGQNGPVQIFDARPLNFPNPLNKFSGDGSGLTNVNGVASVSLTMFGAKNDGVSDSSAAAITAAQYSAATGLGIFINGTNFLFNLAISNLNNVTFTANRPEGQYSGGFNVRPFSATKPVFQVGGDTANVYGFRLLGVTVSGKTTGGVDCPAAVALVGGAYAPTIRDCGLYYGTNTLSIQAWTNQPSTLGSVDCQISMAAVTGTNYRALYIASPPAGSLGGNTAYTTALDLNHVHINGNAYGVAVEASNCTALVTWLYLDGLSNHASLFRSNSQCGKLAGGIVIIDVGGLGQINVDNTAQYSPDAYIEGYVGNMNGIKSSDGTYYATNFSGDFVVGTLQGNILSAWTELALTDTRTGEGSPAGFYVQSTPNSGNVFIGGTKQPNFQFASGPVSWFLNATNAGNGGGFLLRDNSASPNQYKTNFAWYPQGVGAYSFDSPSTMAATAAATSMAFQSSPTITLLGNAWANDGASFATGFLLKSVMTETAVYPNYSSAVYSVYGIVKGASGSPVTNLAWSVDSFGNGAVPGNLTVASNLTVAAAGGASVFNGGIASLGIANTGALTNTGAAGFANNVAISGIVTRYNGQNLVDNGLLGTVTNLDLTGQTAAIGSTALYTAPATGDYLVEGYVEVTTAATSGTISAMAPFTSMDNHSHTLNIVTSTSLSTPSFGDGVHYITMLSGSTLSYQTSFNTVVGTPTYNVHIRLVRQ